MPKIAVAGAAMGFFECRGFWRKVYVVGAIIAFYLNAFAAVVQAFLKVPALNALAPTGTEPPFLVAQVAVLIAFVAVGVVAVKRIHPIAPGVA